MTDKTLEPIELVTQQAQSTLPNASEPSDLSQLMQKETALDQQMRRMRRDAIKEAQLLIDQFQILACELRFSYPLPKPRKNRKNATRRVTPKYRGPKNELWSGQGRTPNWLKNLESQGYNRDDFLIIRY